MARRQIGQETLLLAEAGARSPSLDQIAKLIDWTPVEALLDAIHGATKGEPAWPPLALFKAMLVVVWYDLSDVKLAEALDDRASFRRFCGFSTQEVTPERTAFVRLRKALSACGRDKALFEAVTRQLRAKAVSVKTGTLVDATIIAAAREGDEEARWVKHKGRRAMHGFKSRSEIILSFDRAFVASFGLKTTEGKRAPSGSSIPSLWRAWLGPSAIPR